MPGGFDYRRYLEWSGIRDEGLLRAVNDHYAKLFAGRRRVVDLGCGPGDFLDAVSRAGVRCAGVERDPALFECVRGKGHECMNVDLFEFLESCPPGEFDGMFASHVIEHLEPEKVVRLAELAHGALPRDGLLVLLFPDPQSLYMLSDFWKDPTHVRFYHGDFVAFLLAEKGFEVSRGAPFNFRDYPEKLKKSLRKRAMEAAQGFLHRQLGLKRYTRLLDQLWDRPTEACVVGRRK
ncbi:MAG: methyltransferase domain-containing protein [bacterium]